MDLFDLIGPVMIGPSSSHTAGAARIGLTTRMLMGEDVIRAEIGLHGSFAKTYRGHGTDRALVGGLMGMNVDDERLRESLDYAKKVGFEYSFYNADLRGAHPNTVILDVEGADGSQLQVQAVSVGGGEIVVKSINGLEAGFSGHENTLIITQQDVKGMIAQISSVLTAHSINIATMRVFRRSIGGEAMMVIEVDGHVDPTLINWLKTMPGVFHVAYIAARSEEA